MAIVYPLANGNWSTVANWYSGGVAYGSLPLSTDDVYTNGKSLTLDIDNVVIKSLNNASTTGVLINGTLTINTSKTFTSNTINSNNIGVLNITSTSNIINLISTTINGCVSNSIYTINISGTGGTINITATNIIGNGYPSASSGCVNHNSTGVVNVTGAVSSTTDWAIYNSSSGTLNIIGTITSSNATSYASVNQNNALGTTNFTGSFIGGTNANGYGIYNTFGTVNILSNQTMTGTAGIGVYNNSGTTNWGTVGSPINIYGATSGAASNMSACSLAGGGNVNVYGNIILQSYSWSTTLGLFRHLNPSATLTINGNVTGGTVANTMGITNEQTGTVIVNGNVTGGSNATNTPALRISQAGTLTVNGIVTSNAYPAIFSTVATAKFNILGDIVNTAGLVAYYGSLNVKCSPTTGQSITYRSTSGTDRILATTNVSNGAPVIANVRDGVIYGSTNELMGTLKMALPVDVRVNVPTDNTVGTATITAQDFWDYAVSNLTTNNSIGKRLKNVATVNTTGAQLSAFSS